MLITNRLIKIHHVIDWVIGSGNVNLLISVIHICRTKRKKYCTNKTCKTEISVLLYLVTRLRRALESPTDLCDRENQLSLKPRRGIERNTGGSARRF